MNYHKYYIDRKTCLEKLLRVNEEFLSHVDEWESDNDRLAERESLIEKLHNLNSEYGSDALSHCSPEETTELEAKLHLILALDKDIVSAIEKDRLETLKSMKATTRN